MTLAMIVASSPNRLSGFGKPQGCGGGRQLTVPTPSYDGLMQGAELNDAQVTRYPSMQIDVSVSASKLLRNFVL